MTPIRRSQARAVLESIVRGLAPVQHTRDALYLAVCELAQDRRFWAELEMDRRARVAAAATPAVTAPPEAIEVGHA